MTSEEQLSQIVSSSRNGILATVDPDGFPQIFEYLCCMSDPDSQIIRFSTTMIRRKGRNLLRDPRSAIHVPGPDFFNFAVAAGTAAVAVPERPDDEAVDELFSIHSGLGATSDRDEFGEQMLANHRMAVDCTSIVSTARSSTGQTKGTHD